MSYTIELLPHQSVIIVTLARDFDNETELPIYWSELSNLFEDVLEPTHVITDVREYPVSVNDLIIGTKISMRLRNPYKHENCAMNVLVTNSELIKASVNAFMSVGLAKHLMAAQSVDEALQMIPSYSPT